MVELGYGLASSPNNPVNTQSGNHIQTIAHLSGDSYYHVPTAGTGSYGTYQVLTATGSSGVPAWRTADYHGVHGGGHSHSTSYSFYASHIISNGTISCYALDDYSGGKITVKATLDPYGSTGYHLGTSNYSWDNIYYQNLVSGSDARIKTDIQDLTNANSLALIDSLRPRSFKKLHSDTGEPIDIVNYGLVAQEVEEALTGLNIDKTKLNLIHLPDTETIMKRIDLDGTEAERPNLRHLSYMELVAPLIGAVKELKARIEVLEGL